MRVQLLLALCFQGLNLVAGFGQEEEGWDDCSSSPVVKQAQESEPASKLEELNHLETEARATYRQSRFKEAAGLFAQAASFADQINQPERARQLRQSQADAERVAVLQQTGPFEKFLNQLLGPPGAL